MYRPIAFLVLSILHVCFIPLAAEEIHEIALFPADNIRAGKVAVRINLEQTKEKANLLIDFTPVGDVQAHLYSVDVPREGIDGIGRATLAEVPDGQAYQVYGAFTIKGTLADNHAKVPYYVAGPVRGILPILLPHGDGSLVSCQLAVTYMSCTDTSCNRPVVGRLLTMRLPSHPLGFTGRDEQNQKGLVAKSLQKQGQSEQVVNRGAAATKISWINIFEQSALEEKIKVEHEAGHSVLLNFTGPSCAVCQSMKKTVFLEKSVIAGWNAHTAIKIDTDTSIELALWQQEHFHTQARPLYVRLDADGTVETWSMPFARDDAETMSMFVDFLDNGVGVDNGTGAGFWQFILLAIGGGLFTLMMPCTYPMIPLTVNFFNKQSIEGHSLLPLALSYAFGIIFFFTVIGIVIVFALQSAISSFAGNPWTNLVIALLFLILGLSLLDVYFLRLPHAVSRSFGTGAGGYIGALIMGCTFAITAFTCTAPFAGAVLAEGLQSGSLLRPIVGMMVYSSAIAIPFFVLSISPRLLKEIPHAGSWMSELKHVGGVVEIAAAVKFFVICDFAWGWGIFNRTLSLSLWVAASLFIAAYVFGYVRLSGDTPVKNASIWRILMAMLWLMIGLWFLAGLCGLQHLGIVESFFPADDVPIVG